MLEPSYALAVQEVLAAGLRILQRPRCHAFTYWLHYFACVSLFSWKTAMWKRGSRDPRLGVLLEMPHDQHKPLQLSGCNTAGQQTKAKVRSRKPIPGMLRVPCRGPPLRYLQGVCRTEMWHHPPCRWSMQSLRARGQKARCGQGVCCLHQLLPKVPDL